MKTLNLIQGSTEWMQHRAQAFNASDAPAMLGLSAYKTRNQLLKERTTGITEEIDDDTQRRFNDGHRYEALARTLAEAIIGEDLSPVTGAEGKFSASFDGITFDHTEIFEHKTLNNVIRKSIGANGNTGGLDEMYRIQMEHQLMVSGAKKCLFMASVWDGENCAEEVHCWYLPDLVLRERIIAGWAQFAKDLENYQHIEEKAAPVAEVIMGLPAVSIQATGMIKESNLPEFKLAAETFIANIKTELVTDEDFVNAEANVKFCKAAEDDLEGTKKAILAQTTTIDEAIKVIDYIKGQLASKRLMLDKLVKSEKESRKLAIINKARIAFNEHFVSLESEIKPIRLIAQHPDFAGAIKGLKKLSAMQDAVDSALANGKIEADATAKDVRAKLAWCTENASGMSMLFPDLQALIGMEDQAFQAVIKNRIAEHKAAKAAELETMRVKMQAEEEAKARAKIESEQKAIDTAAQREHEKTLSGETAVLQGIAESVLKTGPAVINGSDRTGEVVNIRRSIRPTDNDIIGAIQHVLGASYGEACDWILETAERLKVAT